MDRTVGLLASLKDYWISNHKRELEKILLKRQESSSSHYSIITQFSMLSDKVRELDVIKEPEKSFELLNISLKHAAEWIYNHHQRHDDMIYKDHLHVRVKCNSSPHHQIPRSSMLNTYLVVMATVVKVTQARVLEYEKTWMCAKCHYTFTLPIKIEDYNRPCKPIRCENPCSECDGYKFSLSTSSTPSRCKDYQEIKIQEQVQQLEVGSMPQSLWVVLEDDLVDCCQPGDDVIIHGYLMSRWRPTVYQGYSKGNQGQNAGSESGPLPQVELVLRANYVEVMNESTSSDVKDKEMQEEFYNFWAHYADDPLRGRNEILLSFCPQVYGLYVIKLAVLLSLVGGCDTQSNKTTSTLSTINTSHNTTAGPHNTTVGPHNTTAGPHNTTAGPHNTTAGSRRTSGSDDDTGVHMRGQSHILLVGDPGTGKSQFLRSASKLIPRSVLTSGVGTTNSGLTCAAVKDGGRWQLEAGALVLADGGLCCIDEFSSMSEHDRASIHEAMEQQTISVAKAGLVCKLNSRCTVLAATNPKGNYDPSQPLTVNTALASPLLSRFDLVLVLLDTKSEKWDSVVANHLLRDELGIDNNDVKVKKKKNNNVWSLRKLRCYLASVKLINPKLTGDAERILEAYYRLQRRNDDRNAARTTVRMLESSIRLAQAHARLMCRDMVSVQDAITSISLLECSMQTSNPLIQHINILHSAFPLNPLEEYITQVDLILTKLDLPDIRDKELEDIHAVSNKVTPIVPIHGSIKESIRDDGGAYDNDDIDECGVLVMTQASQQVLRRKPPTNEHASRMHQQETSINGNHQLQNPHQQQHNPHQQQKDMKHADAIRNSLSMFRYRPGKPGCMTDNDDDLVVNDDCNIGDLAGGCGLLSRPTASKRLRLRSSFTDETGANVVVNDNDNLSVKLSTQWMKGGDILDEDLEWNL